jgi:predicted nucleic acid-binding protein
MVKALLDTCILIDHLNGVAEAREEIARYDAPLISVVTWMEVLVGAQPEVEPATRAFLAAFTQVPLDETVAEAAIRLRRTRRLRLPDAIIAASAEAAGATLVTRNTKDFDEGEPGVRVPYRR